MIYTRTNTHPDAFVLDVDKGSHIEYVFKVDTHLNTVSSYKYPTLADGLGGAIGLVTRRFQKIEPLPLYSDFPEQFNCYGELIEPLRVG